MNWRIAHLVGKRLDVEGQRITVTGKLRVIDPGAAFVGGKLIPGWVEIRVEETK
jgi:hypothetical protein